jgi:hypothetical protein
VKQQGKFILLNLSEFFEWLNKKNVIRVVKLIQNHHTLIPSYKDFNGQNHFPLVVNMETYHMIPKPKGPGCSQIAQNLTTFPDGLIMICRDLEIMPAGIYGANSNGICIEHLGNFDTGHDTMTPEHRETIIGINALLLKKFNLKPNTDSVVYHHWYDLGTGKRTNGTGEVKTCPGTAFFGGNTTEAAGTNFIPLIAAKLP